jgi:WS/DGAT/MGAT family acyltransferase
MTEGNLARRLSAQDASFLYFEREEAPMHIGSIAVFEGQIPYDRFVETIAARLHLIPRYLQKVMPAPFNIGHPTWEWDLEFDIRRHIFQAKLEPPGGESELMDLAGDIFAKPLDRDKPLWEMHLVNDVEGDRSAIISKVHHCLVDGVSGIELLMIVFDMSPNPPPPPPAPAIEKGRPGSVLTRLIESVLDNTSARLERWLDVQRTFIDTTLGGNPIDRAMRAAIETALPYLSAPVVRAPFNKPLGGGRKYASSEFSFAEVRAIRHAGGGTVNDVVLAVLGGALSRYLEMHGQTTDGRSARILTPVNVRRENERGQLGNRVSMLLVEVPVGNMNPLQRLRIIRERTERLKRRNVADGIELIYQMLMTTSPPLQALLASLPQPPNTVANTICTNVPGPMIPLYTVGHRMLAHYPLVPIAWEMGIGCGVTTYNQNLYFGLIGDAKAGPDVARLKEFLDQAYVELRTAAGISKSDLPAVGIAQPSVRARHRRAAAQADRLAADAG